MSLTADGEFFKCDMCGTYFHGNIFCSHRRQCKGPNSQEMKKELVAEVQGQLDKEERARLMRLGQLCRGFDPEVAGADDGMGLRERESRRANLARQEELRRMEKNKRWQKEMFDEEDRELERKLKESEKKMEDLLAGFDD
eukprot:TRINITY_DN2273_c5_g1_i1.p1 TRINITY_DN2273_c5_g1~~TRINITY_DN2273_c5_g1_i1.p1  ORF type:complete len:159 (+),score=54.71 TRINITY_DN2273_c5_g1_i1:60-479(+)